MVKSPDLTGRIALVTGASRGIGYFLARDLAKAGAHVIAVARTVGGLEELDDEVQRSGGSTTLVPLDLKDMEAIDRLGGAVNDRWGKLDILVANAGILGTISPLAHVEARTFEEVMTVNVTSTWRLIRALDPLLRLSDAGRAILLSSGAAHKCRPYWGPYSVSKAAVEALARTWAGELVNTPMRVNSVNPGATRTAMRAKAMPGEDPSALPDPADIAARMLFLMHPELSETGLLFDVSSEKFLHYKPPS